MLNTDYLIMKPQLVHIHGGMTFRSKAGYLAWLKTREISLEKRVKWSEGYLDEALGSKFEIIRLRMPCADNARYKEWEMVFDRYVPFLRDGVVLLGVSLGGVFLAKYLASKMLPVHIRSVHLVAPPFDNSLPGEDLVGGFALRGDLSMIEKNCKDVHFFFSPNDDVVPIGHCEKYAEKLAGAKFNIMENVEGHFQITEFPELVFVIKNVK